MRKINYIVVHCSATPGGLYAYFRGSGGRAPPPWLPHDGLSLLYPERRYCARNPFLGTARCALPRSQQVFDRYLLRRRAGCRGNPKDTRTPEQRSALHLLVYQLLQQFRNARVCGHRDLSPDLDGDGTVEPWEWVKQCPCFEVSKEF